MVHGSGATITATAASGFAFEVENAGRLHLVGLEIISLSSGSAALRCEVATTATPLLALDQVSVDATGIAPLANPCTLSISRSVVRTRSATSSVIAVGPPSDMTIERTLIDGGGGLVFFPGANVAHLTNTVIRNQTGAEGAFSGGGSVFVSFSTVIDSEVKCGAGVPVCAGGTANGVCFDNSIIVNTKAGAPADTVQGSACNASYTLSYPQNLGLSGPNNLNNVDPKLKDIPAADFHLQPSSMAIDFADPASSLLIDYDGATRPQGARRDIGALEYQP